MSFQAFTWVLEQSQSTLGARLVLLSIASHANRDGKNSWPSVETIAIEARLSRRDVFYCLKTLEESGELLIRRGLGRGKVNHYELPRVAQWVQSLHLLEEQKGCKVPSERVQNRTKKGATVAPEPFLNRNSLEPSQTTSTNLFLDQVKEPPKTISEQEVLDIEVLKMARAKRAPRIPSEEELRERAKTQIEALRAKGWI